MSEATVSVLFSEEQIKERVRALAAEIAREYAGKNVLMLCALKGAIIFMTDLARQLYPAVDVEFDFIKVSSYGNESVSAGKVVMKHNTDINLEGRHILLVEDIVDTGHTLAFLQNFLAEQKPASVKICALLDKPDRRVVHEAKYDYLGFSIPDEFVVGYGLDYAQRYRHLPYIGVLHFE